MTWDVEAVRRAWEGHETALDWGRDPVEHDPIRRHCHMVDDTNPRFLERGECPPVMVDYFAAGGAGAASGPDIIALVRRIPTPGDRLVNLGHEFEWLQTVRVGQRLGMRHQVRAIEVRPTRLDPLSVWIRTETTIVDEGRRPVARRLNQIMVHRPPPDAAAGAPAPEAAAARGAGPARDTTGETLPGFSLPLTMTRMVLQVSGSQDFYPVHHDRDFARAGGHADIFLNTGFLRAALCRLVTDWMGPGDFLTALAFQMRRPHLLGDTITVGGRVARRREGGLVDLDVWVENARAGLATPGQATVRLARRD